MPQQIRLWTVDEADRLVSIPLGRLNLEARLETWIERDPQIVEPGLLIIGKQAPTAHGGFIDLLALDGNGDLVIIELKRDKTPREVVAQALDYASWAADLSHDQISELANSYLGPDGPIEVAFRSAFGSDLPDTLNQDHRILVVASAIDGSSERIIRYLSQQHGVRINAVTFQFFTLGSGEVLARVSLLEPSEVEAKAQAKGGSKRRQAATAAELEGNAEANGVGELYRNLVALLRGGFDRTGRTSASITFQSRWRDSRSAVIMSLIPGDSIASRGIRFHLFDRRLAEIWGVTQDAVREALPVSSEPWQYQTDPTGDWTGYAGFFQDTDEALRLLTIRDIRPILA
ncbi:MAG: endonuclease NucS domain-containing protein [Gemmatimonadota bacterium]